MGAAAMAENTSRLSKVCHLRRRSGRPKKSSAASVAPPPKAKIRLDGLCLDGSCPDGSWSAAVDAAVVVMVSFAVTAADPAKAAGAATEQVGASTEPDGLAVTAHVSATVPAKPPLGVTVMVEVPVVLGDAMLMGVPLSVKVVVTIGLDTVIGTLVDSDKLPELPVTVAV